VGLFLAFVAYAPLTQYATTLLSLCREYAFRDAHDYLLHQTGPGTVRYSARLLAGDPTQECTADFARTYVVAASLRSGRPSEAPNSPSSSRVSPPRRKRDTARGRFKATDSLPRLRRWETPFPEGGVRR